SHVLLAVGVDHDEARTAVRFTLPRTLTASLNPVADAVVDAVTAVGSRG
ncbi:cysteine desulfurase, partial [Microbacterium sp. HMWF026]